MATVDEVADKLGELGYDPEQVREELEDAPQGVIDAFDKVADQLAEERGGGGGGGDETGVNPPTAFWQANGTIQINASGRAIGTGTNNPAQARQVAIQAGFNPADVDRALAALPATPPAPTATPGARATRPAPFQVGSRVDTGNGVGTVRQVIWNNIWGLYQVDVEVGGRTGAYRETEVRATNAPLTPGGGGGPTPAGAPLTPAADRAPLRPLEPEEDLFAREELFGTEAARRAAFTQFLERVPLSGPFRRFAEEQFENLQDIYGLQFLANPDAPLQFGQFLEQPNLLQGAFGPGNFRNLLGQAANVLGQPLGAEGLSQMQKSLQELLHGQPLQQFNLAVPGLARSIPPEFRGGFARAARRAFDRWLLQQPTVPGATAPEFLQWLAGRGFQF